MILTWRRSTNLAIEQHNHALMFDPCWEKEEVNSGKLEINPLFILAYCRYTSSISTWTTYILEWEKWYLCGAEALTKLSNSTSMHSWLGKWRKTKDESHIHISMLYNFSYGAVLRIHCAYSMHLFSWFFLAKNPDTVVLRILMIKMHSLVLTNSSQRS
jgi:hypothetical protein